MTSLTYSSPFPTDFVFGVAAAAPQIEGAAFTDGKGESIWDRFSRQPGKVHDGDTLDVACDHYHRFDPAFRPWSSSRSASGRFSMRGIPGSSASRFGSPRWRQRS
ncbi:MAG: family 1 glycosylhydrolase, partial [Burkholderiales bacterium]|nr:family 1 glycosylhydrolase [Burkholderiales bacterium]